MTVERFPYSDFLLGPGKVLPALEGSDVVLERRDDENLVLTRIERFEAAQSGMSVAAHALQALLKRDRPLAEELLTEQLSWLHWLPPDERGDCVRDLLAHLLAGADTNSLLPFARALSAWQSTAEAWSDPELAERVRSDFPGDGPALERPAR
ncbi:hypothetical protein GCM10027445_08480 [Amycolatopsis endophytica]|uniref:Prevent-host-death family protein n=1 Tax=Amycolatopsis endophytica TaxID=860233 RepID=A0A853AWS2_9PSEU|nr:hypothetical protein [Amycolatopsis endophytica]NYI87087.1 hypothetical protein [Amycolatopsis endophytica]